MPTISSTLPMTTSRVDSAAEPEAIRFPWSRPPRPGEGIEIDDHTLWLRFPLPMALDHVNVFACRDSQGWTIVDTGVDTATTRKLWRQAMSGPLAGLPVRRVILTHHHPDHVGLVGWFKSEFGAEILATRVAWLMARMLTLDVQSEYTPETISFMRDAGVTGSMLAARTKERPFNFVDIVHPIPTGFRRIEDGECIEFGGRRWDVRTGGGHAPEHATFWSREGDLVIGGDQFLADISPNIGVFATEPDADPLADWMESCRRFQEIADNRPLILTGHKLPYSGLALRLRQLVDNHVSALERLVDVLEQPRTAIQCFRYLFKREVGQGEFGLALAESVAHLNHLLRSGRISRFRGEDGAWYWKAGNAE